MVFEPDEMAPLRNMRCIISYSQKGNIDNPVDEKKFMDLKEQIQTAIKTLGVPVKVWGADDLINMLDGVLSFNKDTDPADLKWNPYDSLNQQVSSTGTSLQVARDGITVNENESIIKTYSVKREPDHWSLHAMGDLIGDTARDLMQIPCPFMIHYGIHISNQDKTKTRVQTRESWVERQARSKIGKKIPILVKQSRELDFVRHQQSKGERFVQTSFTVSLFAPLESIAFADQVLIKIFRSKRWQLACDSYIQFPQFLSTLPMSWGHGTFPRPALPSKNKDNPFHRGCQSFYPPRGMERN